ncbi:MAG TPA: hypothetical protein VH370_13415 [Humisphaera sp.]|jgi:hypothetical protein|nr:hypothetical protein [Humisphaera sp.]
MVDDPVILALSEQVACYRKLAKLAELQHRYVQNSQTERLLEILQRRQQLIDQLAAHERTLAPAKRRWPEFTAALSPESRGQAEILLGETRKLLEQITSCDRDDVMALQQQKVGLGRQIRQAAVSRQLNRNYAVAAYGRSAPRLDLQR